MLPNPEYARAYRLFATLGYPRMKEITESILGSALIYPNLHAAYFQTPELRRYLDKYLRGSDGTDVVERPKLMKLLWERWAPSSAGGTSSTSATARAPPRPSGSLTWQMAPASGQAGRFKDLAERFRAEYDLGGWTSPDLIRPDDVNGFLNKRR